MASGSEVPTTSVSENDSGIECTTGATNMSHAQAMETSNPDEVEAARFQDNNRFVPHLSIVLSVYLSICIYP